MKQKLVILTGAGISAESGLKTFRDSDGLWEQYRIEDVATPMGWEKDPALVLDFYNQRRRDVLKAKPNAAHLALSKLEEYFDVTIITQNIDDLHERAGSKNIIHLHGEILKSRSSTDPDLLYECRGDIHIGEKCELGSQLRPHVVWFHEAVPMMEPASDVASKSEIFLVIGTSLQVYPAAGLINYAPYFSKKFLVDPNIPEITRIHNLEMIEAKATVGVPPLVEKLIQEFV
ncbi:MAG TPA: NAD-dependent deacylase [Chitinophagales bacterium]|nr:NAD-dependent deacylase [Chitinophagales bacterium]